MAHTATMRAWPGGSEPDAGPDDLSQSGSELPETVQTVQDRVILGRQSIRNRESAVIGYELLTTQAEVPVDAVAGDQTPAVEATDDAEHDLEEDDGVEWLSASACTSGDRRIDLLVGDRTVFYRADRELVTGEVPLTASPDRFVLEIGEELGGDPTVVAGCRALAARGFTIALVEFPWAEPNEELLELAGLVKIDTRGRTAEELTRLRDQLAGSGRQLLADGIETPAELATMRGLGFDLFQGYALAHVPAGPHRDLGASQAGLARMSGLLSHPRDFDEIEDVLRTEPGLAYQIMELASIGRMGETARRVTSLRRALILIGSWRIQTWMAMLLAHPHGQKTNGAMTGALARARACELLARPLGRAEATLGYTAGMISAFEELAQVPRYELEHTLALADELRDAAFGEGTELGRLVSDVADRQEGRANPRGLSGRPIADVDAALAAGYGWAARASAAIA